MDIWVVSTFCIYTAAVNIHVQVFLWMCISFLLAVYFGVGLLSHWNCYIVNCLSSCQTSFQSGYTTIYAHQQCMRVPISPHPCQTTEGNDI